MNKKMISLFIIPWLLALNLFISKPVQANPIVLAADAVYYIAAAMIGAGAVGTLIPSTGIGQPVTGVLGTQAQVVFDGLTVAMKNDLVTQLGTAKAKGYMTLDKVTGLYEALHTAFLATAIVPSVSANGNEFFKAGVALQWHNMGGGINLHDSVYRYSNNQLWVDGIVTATKVGWDYDFSTSRIIGFVTTNMVVDSRILPYMGWLMTVNVLQETAYYMGTGATGTYPVSFPNTVPQSGVQDGSPARPVSYPQTPSDLSNKTATQTFPNSVGVQAPAVPSVPDMNNSDNIGPAAAAAAAAAVAAALAAGYSQAAANAAGVAASNAVKAGSTTAAAATTGAIAADAANTAELTGTAVPNVATPLITGSMGQIPLGPMGLTMQKLLDMDTGIGVAPKVTIPLNAMINCFEGLTHVHSPFPQDDYVLIDFGYLDTFKFAGVSVMEYFRGIIGFGLIIMTWLYCYRKIYSGQVI